ncbi:MAG TPA: HIT family protein [Nitrososphaeraceae archaeon]|jgi:histidine triad (HIT) family protein|nr:HIT family protein [Nitrososphaeraceae archaeon]
MSDTNIYCVFCAIIRGQSPVAKVYEDDTFLAFMDKYPITSGHTLVLPKYHYGDLFQMTDTEVGNMYRVVHTIASAVFNATGAQGLNTGQNNGKAANQIVPHVHVHIIPRYEKDSRDGKWPSRKVTDYKELEELATKIKKNLAI